MSSAGASTCQGARDSREESLAEGSQRGTVLGLVPRPPGRCTEATANLDSLSSRRCRRTPTAKRKPLMTSAWSLGSTRDVRHAGGVAAACAWAALLVVLMSMPPVSWAQPGTMGKTETSSATYYGGASALGTMGGACGYGNLYRTGYGQMNAAASIAFFDKGRICGSCYEVECVSSNIDTCIKGAKVVVTITNQCPQGSEGGWCDRPHRHLDMSMPAWLKIAHNPKAGVITTKMRRVQCPKTGGIKFQVAGNPHWTQLLVFNVGGSGDVSEVAMSKDGGKMWVNLHRNWGQIWSGPGGILGHSLSFKVKTHSSGETLTLMNVVPKSFYLGGTYEAPTNFKGQPRRKRNPRKKGRVKPGHVPIHLRWWRNNKKKGAHG